MRLLGSREHSRAELARKLRARGHAPWAVDEALDVLVEQSLLSDDRMAEVYVDERQGKGFGPLRIRQELRQRGVADALIESHLSQSSEQWLQRMAEVAKKKFGASQSLDRKEQARRARFLEYRGFPSELIARFFQGGDPD